MNYRKKQVGFTLVELMVVVSIIGVLAVLSLNGVRYIRGKSQSVQVNADLRSLAVAVESYAIDNGEKYPISTGEALSAPAPYAMERSLIQKAHAAITLPGPPPPVAPSEDLPTPQDCPALGSGIKVSGPVACGLLSGGYLSKIPKNKYGGSNYQYQSNGAGYTIQGKSMEDKTKWQVITKADDSENFVTKVNQPSAILPVWEANSGLAMVEDGTGTGKFNLNWTPAASVESTVKYRVGYKMGMAPEVMTNFITNTSYYLTGVYANATVKVYAYNSANEKGDVTNQPTFNYQQNQPAATCQYIIDAPLNDGEVAIKITPQAVSSTSTIVGIYTTNLNPTQKFFYFPYSTSTYSFKVYDYNIYTMRLMGINPSGKAVSCIPSSVTVMGG